MVDEISKDPEFKAILEKRAKEAGLSLDEYLTKYKPTKKKSTTKKSNRYKITDEKSNITTFKNIKEIYNHLKIEPIGLDEIPVKKAFNVYTDIVHLRGLFGKFNYSYLGSMMFITKSPEGEKNIFLNAVRNMINTSFKNGFNSIPIRVKNAILKDVDNIDSIDDVEDFFKIIMKILEEELRLFTKNPEKLINYLEGKDGSMSGIPSTSQLITGVSAGENNFVSNVDKIAELAPFSTVMRVLGITKEQLVSDKKARKKLLRDYGNSVNMIYNGQISPILSEGKGNDIPFGYEGGYAIGSFNNIKLVDLGGIEIPKHPDKWDFHTFMYKRYKLSDGKDHDLFICSCKSFLFGGLQGGWRTKYKIFDKPFCKHCIMFTIYLIIHGTHNVGALKLMGITHESDVVLKNHRLKESIKIINGYSIMDKRFLEFAYDRYFVFPHLLSKDLLRGI